MAKRSAPKTVKAKPSGKGKPSGQPKKPSKPPEPPEKRKKPKKTPGPKIKFGARRQGIFLKSFKATAKFVSSAKAAGVDPGTVYNALARDEGFRDRYRAAQEEAADVLEAELMRRAVAGCPVEVWHGGEMVGFSTKWSDAALTFALKNLRSERWAERAQTDLTSSDGTMSPKGATRLVIPADKADSFKEAFLAALKARKKESD